jgi:hypothetical protein
MTPPSYVLVRVGVPNDALDFSAVDPSREPARTPAVGGEKATVSVSLSPTGAHARRPLQRSSSDASTRAEEPRHPRPAPVTQRRRQSRRARKFSRQTPPLETLAPALSRPYKKAPSTPQTTTPPEHNTPALLSSSSPRKRPSSASVRRRVPKDSGHHWSHRRCQAEESSQRRRSASPPTRTASSPSSPAVEHLLSATPVSPWPARGRRRSSTVGSRSHGDVPVHLLKIRLTGRPHLSDSKLENSPARRSGIGPAHSCFFGSGPVLLEFDMMRFFIFPPVSKFVSDMIFKSKFPEI